MSHFSVLVIGHDVEKQLQPFHEFECTGTVDEYVQNIDQLEEARAEFGSYTDTHYKSPVGELVDAYDARFYRDPTPEESKKIGPLAGTGVGHGLTWTSRDWGDGRGYRAKIHFLPDGWHKVELPRKSRISFAEHIEGYYDRHPVPEGCEPDLQGKHKFGWYRVNASGDVTELIRRTNPEKKWDWWIIGGRWTGKLKLKEKAVGTVGRPGLMTEHAPPGYADQALKGDIDFAQMRNDAEVKARALWKTTREITGGLSWESWDDTRIRYPNIEDARREYWEQPAVELLKASGREAYKWGLDDDLALDEEIYVSRQRASACTFFAFLRDGQWTERGAMGWFASVSNEISKIQWDTMFNDMLDALPDDSLLTVVDCHI